MGLREDNPAHDEETLDTIEPVEPDLIPARAVALSLLVSALFVLACVALVHAFYPESPRMFERFANGAPRTGPGLQLDPEGDLRKLREREAARLQSAPVPLDEAMKRVLADQRARAGAPAGVTQGGARP